MDFHNVNEDFVVNSVDNIFDEIRRSGNHEKFCLCYQCRIDTICYTLNRIEPNYIVSNRGFDRIDSGSFRGQQLEADIQALIYKGIRLVNHNLRPTAPHDGTQIQPGKVQAPLFDIPTISGRIFNGVSFEPIIGIDVYLYMEGALVAMRNNNWQNPFTMVESTPGVFSFWPQPLPAEAPEITRDFNFAIKVFSSEYEPLNHFFTISTTSKYHNPQSYMLNKKYKLPDMYLFPPGDDENQ